MEVAQFPSARICEMSGICDLCGQRPGVLTDRTVVNNGMVEFHFCEQCYAGIRRSGLTTVEVMSRVTARLGKECPVCGTAAEDFAKNFEFGCPEKSRAFGGFGGAGRQGAAHRQTPERQEKEWIARHGNSHATTSYHRA